MERLANTSEFSAFFAFSGGHLRGMHCSRSLRNCHDVIDCHRYGVIDRVKGQQNKVREASKR